MNRFLLLVLATGILFSFPPAQAAVLHVPANYATIQAAIAASSHGDTVLVAPGTYSENLNFLGKNIVVSSYYLLGPDTTFITTTIIDGSHPLHPDTASCVLFVQNESSAAILQGFTLTGGTGTVWRDRHNGGIYREGGGILTDGSSPTIRYNRIVYNTATNTAGVSSAGGGAIRSDGGTPSILNNVIVNNTGRYGAAITLNYTGAIIKHNIIARNSGGEDFGGSGIWAYADGPSQKIVENNTIINNVSASDGGGVLVWSTSATLRNNIIWGNKAGTNAQISLRPGGTVTASFNDIQGGWTGTGNINQDPGLLCLGSYLATNSPCIDAGDISGPSDPADPLQPTLAAWPSLGGIRNDMGAYGGTGRTVLGINQDMNPPVLIWPPNSAINTVGIVKLRWYNNSCNAPYHVQLSTDSTFATGLIIDNHAVNDTTIALQVDSNGARWFWRVRSAQGGTSWSSVRSFSNQVIPPAAPVLQSPADGALNQPISLTFRWGSESGSSQYHFQLAADSLFQSTLIDDSAQLETIRPVSGLQNNTRYYWRVKGRNFSGEGEYSPVWSFTTIVGTPPTPAPTSPPSGSLNMPMTVSLHWSTVATAARYRLQIWLDSLFRGIVLDTSLLTPELQVGSLRSSTRYFWRVRSTNIAGSSPFTPLWNFSTKPLSSVLIAPADGEEITTFPTLIWSKVGSALRYQLELARDTTFASVVLNDSLRTDTTCVLSSLHDSALYFWRVRALDARGYSDWSVRSFVVRISSVTKEIAVHAGWNMISVPVTVPDLRRTTVFPSALAPTFAYAGIYEERDTIENRAGYWIKFPSSQVVQVTGLPRMRDTITLNGGWNLIGSVAQPVPWSEVISSPAGLIVSALFTYWGSYFTSDTLLPGCAYWVQASGPGSLVLEAGGVSRKASASSYVHVVPSTEAPPAAPQGGQSERMKTPTAYRLSDGYPNPFNPSTTIRYEIPAAKMVRISVYNMLGEEIAILVNEEKQPGEYQVKWDATHVPSGVYFSTIESGRYRETRKLVLLK